MRIASILSVLTAILLSILVSACFSRYDSQGRNLIGVDELFGDKTFDVTLHVEEKEPYRVYRESDGVERVIGVLTYQFPDVPARTIVLPVGYGYLIVGQIGARLCTLEYLAKHKSQT